MGAYLWFWLIPGLSLLEEGVVYLWTGKPLGGSWEKAILMPAVFVAVFALTGYRITVDQRGLRVTGLGFMRVHAAFYAWIWNRASVVPGELEGVQIERPNALLRFINWPLLFPGTRSRQHFAFGTPSIVRIRRKNRKDLTLGTRRPDELQAAVGNHFPGGRPASRGEQFDQ